MQKALSLAKRITTAFDHDYSDDLKEYDLHITFARILSCNYSQTDKNKCICYVIYAFDPESPWLDLKKDRIDNKMRILKNIDADASAGIYSSLIDNTNEIVGDCIFNYLEDEKSWKWRAVYNLLDYSARMIRFANEETPATYVSEETTDKDGNIVKTFTHVDVDEIGKGHLRKGDIMDQSIKKRREAETILEEIRKELVSTDAATQSDFGFNFTDTAKQRDIMSWSQFIAERNERKKAEKLSSR